MYAGRRSFRSPPWLIVASIIAALLFAAAAWALWRGRGLGPMTIFMALFVAIALAGVMETIMQRVVLTDDALHVVLPWSRRIYPRSKIQNVSSEKASPTMIQLSDGKWVKLPPVGHYVANSIRAWLRATE